MEALMSSFVHAIEPRLIILLRQQSMRPIGHAAPIGVEA